MKLGLLWFDANPKLTPQRRLAEAAARYVERFGRPANCCHVHPEETFAPNGEVAGASVVVVPDAAVLKHHIWVGFDEAYAPEPVHKRRRAPVRRGENGSRAAVAEAPTTRAIVTVEPREPSAALVGGALPDLAPACGPMPGPDLEPTIRPRAHRAGRVREQAATGRGRIEGKAATTAVAAENDAGLSKARRPSRPVTESAGRTEGKRRTASITGGEHPLGAAAPASTRGPAGDGGRLRRGRAKSGSVADEASKTSRRPAAVSSSASGSDRTAVAAPSASGADGLIRRRAAARANAEAVGQATPAVQASGDVPPAGQAIGQARVGRGAEVRRAMKSAQAPSIPAPAPIRVAPVEKVVRPKPTKLAVLDGKRPVATTGRGGRATDKHTSAERITVGSAERTAMRSAERTGVGMAPVAAGTSGTATDTPPSAASRIPSARRRRGA